jgi:hypothetical protein
MSAKSDFKDNLTLMIGMLERANNHNEIHDMTTREFSTLTNLLAMQSITITPEMTNEQIQTAWINYIIMILRTYEAGILAMKIIGLGQDFEILVLLLERANNIQEIHNMGTLDFRRLRSLLAVEDINIYPEFTDKQIQTLWIMYTIKKLKELITPAQRTKAIKTTKATTIEDSEPKPARVRTVKIKREAQKERMANRAIGLNITKERGGIVVTCNACKKVYDANKPPKDINNICDYCGK